MRRGSVSGVAYLVGPASVGKSTTGPIVAELCGLPFADLDLEFCDVVGLIPEYIAGHGYAAYCAANAELAARIVGQSPDLVLATSSGFLAHDNQDDVVARNQQLIRGTGYAFLLRLSLNDEAAAMIMAKRQAARWPGRLVDREYEIARTRIGRYAQSAAHVVSAEGPPSEVGLRVIAAWTELVASEAAGSVLERLQTPSIRSPGPSREGRRAEVAVLGGEGLPVVAGPTGGSRHALSRDPADPPLRRSQGHSDRS